MRKSSRQLEVPERICACGAVFTPYRISGCSEQKSCSIECAREAKNANERAGSVARWARIKDDPDDAIRRRENAARVGAKPARRAKALAHNIARYGITVDQLVRMTEAQSGLCAICGNPPSGIGKTGQRLHIDHDHITGVVRGLLCEFCNRGLGMFRDNPSLLTVAIQYLDSQEATA